jgi:hypothetical protein
MRKSIFKVLACFIVTCFVFFPGTIFAQKGQEKIDLKDVSKFIVDAPVYPGESNMALPVISLHDLIKATIDLTIDAGGDVGIYNYNTLVTNPPNVTEYIALMTSENNQGFAIIYTNEQESKSGSEIVFSILCDLKGDDLTGPICNEPKITELSQDITVEKAFKTNPIFQRAVKDSKKSTWSAAN